MKSYVKVEKLHILGVKVVFFFLKGLDASCSYARPCDIMLLRFIQELKMSSKDEIVLILKVEDLIWHN